MRTEVTETSSVNDLTNNVLKFYTYLYLQALGYLNDAFHRWTNVLGQNFDMVPLSILLEVCLGALQIFVSLKWQVMTTTGLYIDFSTANICSGNLDATKKCNILS